MGGRALLVAALGALCLMRSGTNALVARRGGFAPAMRLRPLVRPQQQRGEVSMVGFFNRGRKSTDSDVAVSIERLAPNVRRISGTCVVDCEMEDVWAVLTDYDNLSEHVPNLVQSSLRPHPDGGIRLFQEGAQKIVGFNFRASLTMDMTEKMNRDMDALPTKAIGFKLVDSQMFNEFDGEWKLDNFSRKKKRDPVTGAVVPGWSYSTKMFYSVTIKPKGLVPVGALEWRIQEDVPTNMIAVKKAAEERGPELRERAAARAARAEAKANGADVSGGGNGLINEVQPYGFETGETLAGYISRAQNKAN